MSKVFVWIKMIERGKVLVMPEWIGPNYISFMRGDIESFEPSSKISVQRFKPITTADFIDPLPIKEKERSWKGLPAFG